MNNNIENKSLFRLPVDCCGNMIVRDYTLENAVSRAIDILNEHLGTDLHYHIIDTTEEIQEGNFNYHLRVAVHGEMWVRAEDEKAAWKLADRVLGEVLDNVGHTIQH